MSDLVAVTWHDCTCEWRTKYCDEEHAQHTLVPRSVLIAAATQQATRITVDPSKS